MRYILLSLPAKLPDKIEHRLLDRKLGEQLLRHALFGGYPTTRTIGRKPRLICSMPISVGTCPTGFAPAETRAGARDLGKSRFRLLSRPIQAARKPGSTCIRRWHPKYPYRPNCGRWSPECRRNFCVLTIYSSGAICRRRFSRCRLRSSRTPRSYFNGQESPRQLQLSGCR